MGRFGIAELVVILVIVLLLFGAKRLPQLGVGIGGFIKGLRRGSDESPALPPDTSPEPRERRG